MHRKVAVLCELMEVIVNFGEVEKYALTSGAWRNQLLAIPQFSLPVISGEFAKNFANCTVTSNSNISH
jgi:hypothetical protein